MHRDSAPSPRLAAPAGRVAGAACLALALLALPAGLAAEAAYPLEPPDRSSPRATLATFTHSVDRAWALYSKRDPAFRDPFGDAVRCLDLSAVSTGAAEIVGIETTLALKEVLDRLALPSDEEIPGRDEVTGGLLRWTIPHTEITLVKSTSPEQAGEFLFTPGTVARAREYHERVRRLPYQPGRHGAHYDELRFGGLSPGLSRLAADLPASFQREIAGALVWQWAVMILVLLLAGALLAPAFRLGRRLARWEEGARGGRRFGPFVFPLALAAAALVSRAVAFRVLRLAGLPYVILTLVLKGIAHLAAAWLIAVALNRLCQLVLRVFRTPERPLNAQLVGISFRILTILAVTGYLFVAAQSLGLPVPALVAGLGSAICSPRSSGCWRRIRGWSRAKPALASWASASPRSTWRCAPRSPPRIGPSSSPSGRTCCCAS
jgi:MscS family membrane protein